MSLELGCGDRKRHPDAIGVDLRDLPGVDVVGDVFDVLARIPDGSVDEVHSYHFLEHLDRIDRLVHQLARIVKPGGRVTTVVPHFSNPYYYSDPTHRTPFGLYSFSYLARDELFSRRVPQYGGDSGFRLVRARLVFKAPRPFVVRYAIARAIGVVVNSCTFAQELYEGVLSPWLPCYEVEFVLSREG